MGRLGRIVWNGANAIKITHPQYLYAHQGFYFLGQYMGTQIGALPAQNTSTKSIIAQDLLYFNNVLGNHWYAAFLVNDTTYSRIKICPYIRVTGDDISGYNQTLSLEERASIQDLRIYPFHDFIDMKALHITSSGIFSGNIINISCYDSILNIDFPMAEGDTLLMAPSTANDFTYLGSFYLDSSGEPRNIADNNTDVMAYMSSHADFPDGVAQNIKLDFTTYVSPLATGVIIDEGCYIQAGVVGGLASYWKHDSIHTICNNYAFKESPQTWSIYWSNLFLNFSLGPYLNYETAGQIDEYRSYAKCLIRGWIE